MLKKIKQSFIMALQVLCTLWLPWKS